MALLQLDTDSLRSVVSAAKQANAAIEEAANLLNSIVEHNDWECSERATIINYTRENKRQINTLEENAGSYYNAVNRAADRFEEEEQRHIAAQGSVDSILASIHNVVPNAGGISVADFSGTL